MTSGIFTTVLQFEIVSTSAYSIFDIVEPECSLQPNDQEVFQLALNINKLNLQPRNCGVSKDGEVEDTPVRTNMGMAATSDQQMLAEKRKCL